MSESSKTSSLIIFTKDEQEGIASLAAEIKNTGIKFKNIVAVDDSSDGTADKMKSFGWKVIRGEGSLGRAFVLGITEAMKDEADYFITLDGDGQADPSEIGTFLRHAQEHQADLVIGSRFLGRKGLVEYHYSSINRIGVSLLALFLSAETLQNITDSHGGIRCQSRRFCEGMRIVGSHTYVQEAILSARDRRLKIIEIPTRWRERQFGESKVVRSISKYVIRVLPTLIYRSRWVKIMVGAGVISFLIF
jgi:glycosyltransferase involved in cell wall biosynthesis